MSDLKHVRVYLKFMALSKFRMQNNFYMAISYHQLITRFKYEFQLLITFINYI